MTHNSRSSLVYLAALSLLLLAPTLSKTQAANSSASPENLTCSQAPCILPNVAVSQGGYEKDTNMIAANPVDPSHLLVMAEDYTCVDSRNSLFSSSDGGSTWSEPVPFDPARVAGEVEFRDVGFHYDEAGGPTLRDINFVAPAGSRVAIVELRIS